MRNEPKIDAYIARAQPFARDILTHVRERVHAALPEVEESVKWGMPAYTVGRKIVLITAAFKAHAALNFWRGQELETSHSSVGAIRSGGPQGEACAQAGGRGAPRLRGSTRAGSRR